MSADFNFTVTSWFLVNVRVKPYFNTQWGGGAKNGLFLSRLRVKNCPGRGGGGQKMVNFCPCSCWMTPKKETSFFLSITLYSNYAFSPLLCQPRSVSPISLLVTINWSMMKCFNQARGGTSEIMGSVSNVVLLIYLGPSWTDLASYKLLPQQPEFPRSLHVTLKQFHFFSFKLSFFDGAQRGTICLLFGLRF